MYHITLNLKFIAFIALCLVCLDIWLFYTGSLGGGIVITVIIILLAAIVVPLILICKYLRREATPLQKLRDIKFD